MFTYVIDTEKEVEQEFESISQKFPKHLINSSKSWNCKYHNTLKLVILYHEIK